MRRRKKTLSTFQKQKKADWLLFISIFSRGKRINDLLCFSAHSASELDHVQSWDSSSNHAALTISPKGWGDKGGGKNGNNVGYNQMSWCSYFHIRAKMSASMHHCLSQIFYSTINKHLFFLTVFWKMIFVLHALSTCVVVSLPLLNCLSVLMQVSLRTEISILLFSGYLLLAS